MVKRIVRFARFWLLIEIKIGQRAKRLNLFDGGDVSPCRKSLLSSTRMPVTVQQDPSGRRLNHMQKIGWDLLMFI